NRGKFHIYGVYTLSEALTLMTGLPIDTMNEKGRYRKDTLFGKVLSRLMLWDENQESTDDIDDEKSKKKAKKKRKEKRQKKEDKRIKEKRKGERSDKKGNEESNKQSDAKPIDDTLNDSETTAVDEDGN
ncbi:hypothetical protein ACTXGQ_25900, partial [Marinobacter sp. 1Y8]